MVWPANLAVYYPHPGLQPWWQVLGAVVLLGAVTFLVIRSAKRFPYLAMGWLWYAGTLVPVIGIVQVGTQAMADRYAYIPLIGLFVMAAWGIPELLKRWRCPKEAPLVSSALILPCLLFVTWTQVGYWRNSIALFDHSLKVTGQNNTVLNNRGAAYEELSDHGRAIEDYDKAIEIDPEYAEAYYNRGVANSELGNHRQAIEDYDRAIEINPRYADAYGNRGAVYGLLGNNGKSIEDYDKAIEINPEHARAFNNRGLAYARLGNTRQAVEDYSRAVEINPDYVKAYYNRAVAYGELGDRMHAIEDLKTAAGFGNEGARNSLRKMGIKW